ncbi:MAG: ABC transporter permease [Anaerolineae bacterium]
MKKVLNIAWKDLIVLVRDPGALALMLVTPFALTLAIAFAFGGLTGGGNSGLQEIPVVVVNHDPGQMGQTLVDVLQSEELADLLAPTLMDDDDAARAAVDADNAAAAVLIPEDLSESIMPAALLEGDFSSLTEPEQSVIHVYSNPTAPISAGVVRSVVDQFLGQVAAGATGGELAVTQMVVEGIISPAQIVSVAQQVGEQAGRQAVEANLIAVEGQTQGEEEGGGGFDWMGYMAPSMAILFLMFTVSAGGRSILAERDEGTLPRMLISPSSAAQVIGGKVAGIYLTGLLQVLILVAASGLIFGVRWGDPGAVVLVTLALVAAATGWGMLIAAFSRTPGQANAAGTGLALVFGVASGNFFPRETLPQWLRTVSYVTPNAWGLEAFGDLSAAGSLAGVLLPIAALLVMAVILFVVATVALRRQYG